MSTRISAGVGDRLLFITMIPIDRKITNFPLYLFVYLSLSVRTDPHEQTIVVAKAALI